MRLAKDKLRSDCGLFWSALPAFGWRETSENSRVGRVVRGSWTASTLRPAYKDRAYEKVLLHFYSFLHVYCNWFSDILHSLAHTLESGPCVSVFSIFRGNELEWRNLIYFECFTTEANIFLSTQREKQSDGRCYFVQNFCLGYSRSWHRKVEWVPTPSSSLLVISPHIILPCLTSRCANSSVAKLLTVSLVM